MGGSWLSPRAIAPNKQHFCTNGQNEAFFLFCPGRLQCQGRSFKGMWYLCGAEGWGGVRAYRAIN